MASPRMAESQGSSIDSLPSREPNLDDVVGIFLKAKNSLSRIHQVTRAQAIVELGKYAVEENAVLAARNTFSHYAISVQLDSLQAIRLGAKLVENDAHDEMREKVDILDKASSRLDKTLEDLRKVSVTSAFRPEGEEPRTLFDFIDESGVEALYIAVKDSMDRYEAARSTLMETCQAFDNDLKTIYQAMEPNEEDDVSFPADEASPIPAYYADLENNATDMASHLQGLVKHYDMCVTALKHTEGGGEAILKFSRTEVNHDESQIAGIGLGIASLDDTAPKPVTTEEYSNMLQVLVRDANEVEEVTVDVEEKLAEMEEQLAQVQGYLGMLRSSSSGLDKALAHLKRVSNNIPAYINSCADFQTAWDEEKEFLDDKLTEMKHGQEFYQGFASGYYSVILEVQRRRRKRREMDKIAKTAMAEIEKLFKADVKAREEFRAEEGEHLPIDIWPGLSDTPARYEINVLEEKNELPVLKQEVVEEALRKLGIS